MEGINKIHILILLLFVSINIFAQSHTLQVQLEGFSKDGIAYIMLYKEEQDFDANSKKCLKRKINIKNKKAVISYKSLASGEYAIIIFHDENLNGKMDTNFIGMPKEGVGVSNNTRGIPSFKKSAFILKENKHLKIKMKYL